MLKLKDDRTFMDAEKTLVSRVEESHLFMSDGRLFLKWSGSVYPAEYGAPSISKTHGQVDLTSHLEDIVRRVLKEVQQAENS